MLAIKQIWADDPLRCVFFGVPVLVLAGLLAAMVGTLAMRAGGVI